MTGLSALVARERHSWRRLALAAVLTALTCLCGSALMGFSAWLISRAAEHPDASALTLAAVAVRALGLGRGLSRYAERLVGHDATLRSVADLRVDVYRSLVRGRTSEIRSGEVLSSVVSDVDAAQDVWLRCLLPTVAALAVMAVSVLACWLWLPSAGLVLLLGLSSSLVVLPLLAARLSRQEASTAGLRARQQVQSLDVLHGLADLTAFGELSSALGAADASAAELAALEARAGLRGSLLTGLATALQGVTVLVVALVGVAAVHDGQLPRVGLAVVVLVAFAAFEPVGPVVDAGALLPKLRGAAQRLTALLAEPAVERTGTASETGPLQLERVSVRYPGIARGVLHDVDLSLRQGQIVALVGASGSGKSTLLKALAGQQLFQHGTARVGGIDLTQLSDAERARHVVLAEQQAYLFDTTIRDNLRLARPGAALRELESAAEVAGLGPWIDGLPQGWDTRVGERGGQVSGGERKRISVARALLADTPFLLLDEPTEGLDGPAADDLVRRVVAARRDRGVLLVTHRSAVLEEVDAVFRLHAGHLTEVTCPRDLVPCSPPSTADRLTLSMSSTSGGTP